MEEAIYLNFPVTRLRIADYLSIRIEEANFWIFSYCADKFTQKYDTETLLTRMLLKGMIEYVSSSVQPSSLQAAMLKLNNIQFEDEVHNSHVAVGPVKKA